MEPVKELPSISRFKRDVSFDTVIGMGPVTPVCTKARIVRPVRLPIAGFTGNWTRLPQDRAVTTPNVQLIPCHVQWSAAVQSGFDGEPQV